MKIKEFIYNSLKALYGNNLYDVDNDIKNLSLLGFNLNSRKPDFIIKNSNYFILIELKEINENKEDINTKNDLINNGRAFYCEPNLFAKFSDKINDANNQFKNFIQNNSKNFLEFPTTIVLVISHKFTTEYTIIESDKFIFGETIETLNPFGDNTCEIKNAVLNKGKHTSTSFIGIWNEKNKYFSLYKNIYCKKNISFPFFITKNDINFFLLENYIDETIRIKKYKIIKFKNKSEEKFLVNDLFVNEDNLQNYLKSEKIKNKRIKDRQLKILNKK